MTIENNESAVERQRPSAATRSLVWGMRIAPWMMVGLCIVLMAVGASVKDRQSKAGILEIAPGALVQGQEDVKTDAPKETTGASADTKSPEGAKSDAAPVVNTDAKEKPPEGDAVTPPKTDEKPAAKTDAPPAKTDAKPAEKKPAEPALNMPKKSEGGTMSWVERAISFLGIFAFLLLAFLMSNARKKINWRLVIVGTVMQIAFAAFIFFVPFGQTIFEVANDVVVKLLDFTNEGSKFIFASFITGKQEVGLINFSFAVLPTIIFFSSFMTVMYHLGIMDFIVKGVAWVMLRALGTSGAESLSAAANIFVGQTEAPLVVKPFIKEMTQSELMTVMTGGFATVAGGVLALYVGMLRPVFPDIAGHLIAASVMSAPAALVIGKMMVPEVETPTTMGSLKLDVEKPDANAIEAAARGASEGLKLALNVGAMLLAFIALVAMMNYLIGLPSLMYNKHQYKNTLAVVQLEDLQNVRTYAAKAGITLPKECDKANAENVGACLAALPGPLLKAQSDGALKTVTLAKAFAPECRNAKIADDKIKGCAETLQKTGGASAANLSQIRVVKFQDLLALIFWPIAFIMGVPFGECWHVAQLLGTKVILNELVAYSELLNMLKDPAIQLSERSVIISTYALCGFANLSSIAIQVGGLGEIAPSRRSDLARLGLRAMVAGIIAACMTGTIAGILI